MENYGLYFDHILINCDNTNAIYLRIPYNILKQNTLNHFLRDHVQKEDIELMYVHTGKQLTDIFTNPLMRKDFASLDMNLVYLKQCEHQFLNS